MFRYPNPTHYVNALGAKAKRRQGQKAKPKGGYQPKGKAKRGGPQPQRRTRRRMRDEIQPYAVGPDGRVYLAGGAEFPVPRLQQQQQQPRQPARQSLAPGLSQWVNHGDDKFFVTKINGVQRAIKKPNKKMVANTKQYSGPTFHKGKIWITEGNHIREATDADLANIQKFNSKNDAHAAKIKSGPHQTIDLIRQAKTLIDKGCKKDSVQSFDRFKEEDRVGKILSGATEFANSVMNREGFFSDSRDNYKPRFALQYAYHGYKVEGFGDDTRIPRYILNFDDAWYIKREMSDQDRFKAARVFMAKLSGDMVVAILDTIKHKKKLNEEAQLAKAVAERGRVANTRDAVENARTAAREIIDSKEDVPMKDKGEATDLIIREICMIVLDEIGSSNLNKNGFDDYCINNQKNALKHFYNAHEQKFEDMMKSAKNKAKKMAKKAKSAGRAPPSKAEASFMSAPASRGLNLVSMRS